MSRTRKGETPLLQFFGKAASVMAASAVVDLEEELSQRSREPARIREGGEARYLQACILKYLCYPLHKTFPTPKKAIITKALKKKPRKHKRKSHK